jgi:hypothetical protein
MICCVCCSKATIYFLCRECDSYIWIISKFSCSFTALSRYFDERYDYWVLHHFRFRRNLAHSVSSPSRVFGLIRKARSSDMNEVVPRCWWRSHVCSFSHFVEIVLYEVALIVKDDVFDCDVTSRLPIAHSMIGDQFVAPNQSQVTFGGRVHVRTIACSTMPRKCTATFYEQTVFSLHGEV